jgi:hypothetical protein
MRPDWPKSLVPALAKSTIRRAQYYVGIESLAMCVATDRQGVRTSVSIYIPQLYHVLACYFARIMLRIESASKMSVKWNSELCRQKLQEFSRGAGKLLRCTNWLKLDLRRNVIGR